jgi:hypothetical protein
MSFFKLQKLGKKGFHLTYRQFLCYSTFQYLPVTVKMKPLTVCSLHKIHKKNA